MKKTLLLIVLIFGVFESFSQVIKTKGTIFFFFTEKIPENHVNPPQMYCLDSIRLITQKSTFAVLGDFAQHEFFSHERPKRFKLDSYTKIARSTNLYVTNPQQNHVHQGGEIYEKENNRGKIFIAFNIKAEFYKAVAENTNRNDSIKSELERTREDFINSMNEEPCAYYINENDYLIITRIIKATKLTKRQQKRLGLIKSDIQGFWRYGLW